MRFRLYTESKREFDSESPTSNYASRIKYENLKVCWFNWLIKPLAMIHGPGQAGPWIDRWLKSGFENRYEARLGLRK